MKRKITNTAEEIKSIANQAAEKKLKELVAFYWADVTGKILDQAEQGFDHIMYQFPSRLESTPHGLEGKVREEVVLKLKKNGFEVIHCNPLSRGHRIRWIR